MKKINRIVWGVILVALGVVFALSAFGVNVDIFFEGWWTLFIIVPCAVGLLTEREKLGNAIGVLIGVLLLLAVRDVIDFDLLWKLLIPGIVILVGLKMIFSGIFGGKDDKAYRKLKEKLGDCKNGTAVFAGSDMKFAGEVFEGAELNAIFGGIACDLRGAVIQKDCILDASAIFGGIDVFVPEGLNVKIRSTSVFGGVSEKKKNPADENAPTLYVNAVCLFGGLDIK